MPKDNEKLTIGMLCYDDFHGTWMTIVSALLHHPEVADQIRFVVVDNNPDSKHGKEVANQFASHPKIDYHAISGATASSYKNLVFELARTPYVVCMDCHVMLPPKTLQRLIRFFDANQGSHDLYQGPMVGERMNIIATHMTPAFRGGNFGVWGIDPRGLDEKGAPFEIPMHGMGLFATTRDGWLRYAAGMRSFGSEEGTIHEKYRLAGRKAWCLPFLRWAHRFGRPDGAPYPASNYDKVRNYMLGFREVHLPLDSIIEHYRYKLDNNKQKSESIMQALVDEARMMPEPYIAMPENYKPFLGNSIQVLEDIK